MPSWPLLTQLVHQHTCVRTTQALLFVWVWLAHLLFEHVPRLQAWAFLPSALGSHTDPQSMLSPWEEDGSGTGMSSESPAAVEAGVVDPSWAQVASNCGWQSCRLHAASSSLGVLFRVNQPIPFFSCL